jgi:hypothetical protein
VNKEECVLGQRVKINPQLPYLQRFNGLIGVIKELPLGFVIVELTIPLLVGEIEPVDPDGKMEDK